MILWHCAFVQLIFLSSVFGSYRPIIGILSQAFRENGKVEATNKTYIAASYVKYIESAGARVIPILLHQNDSYHDEIFNGVNGILFPGGSSALNDSTYSDIGKLYYNKAVQANDRGDYFPIWGTCLGFELLSYFLANETNILVPCQADDISLPLTIPDDYSSSRLWDELPIDVFQYLVNYPVTSNFHHFCLTIEEFNKAKLQTKARILSTNRDRNNLEFISTIELKHYPIYGVQWHPEKNNFEWSTKETSIPHSYEAVRVAQHMANFFVNEARKNTHRFANQAAEQKHLIYNYMANYTGKKSNFEQMYLFDAVNVLQDEWE